MNNFLITHNFLDSDDVVRASCKSEYLLGRVVTLTIVQRAILPEHNCLPYITVSSKSKSVQRILFHN